MKKSTSENRRKWSAKLLATVRKWVMLFLNPRFLLCFGMGWMITNGWAYVMLGLGILLDSAWACSVAGAYLAFLWIPMTPEKIITVAIAVFLLKKCFPNDEKTLGVLREIADKAKASLKKRKKRTVKDRE